MDGIIFGKLWRHSLPDPPPAILSTTHRAVQSRHTHSAYILSCRTTRSSTRSIRLHSLASGWAPGLLPFWTSVYRSNGTSPCVRTYEVSPTTSISHRSCYKWSEVQSFSHPLFLPTLSVEPIFTMKSHPPLRFAKLLACLSLRWPASATLPGHQCERTLDVVGVRKLGPPT